MLVKVFLANSNLFILRNLNELNFSMFQYEILQKTQGNINQTRLSIDLVKNLYLAAVHILLV